MRVFWKRLAEKWNEWDVRTMVVASLLIQIILIVLGNRRKYSNNDKIRFVLWFAYLSADWIATAALGVLSSSEQDSKSGSLDPNYVIMAFWAPFLLIHLGGPDTITAYSLEDNELWRRHALVLIVQVGLAVYVFVRSLKLTQLNFVAIPLLIAGVIKYGERTWVLRSASGEQFRESLLPRPDPGPNYEKLMEDYVLKEREGFELSWRVTKAPKVAGRNYGANTNPLVRNAANLNAAYDFFVTYKRLFADLILSFEDIEKSQLFFRKASCEDAFQVIEFELGFMYDLLYTKASTIYTIWGGFLRLTSLSLTIAALVAFSVIDRQEYSLVDVIVTFVLQAGAICIEMYALLALLSSDWALLWFGKHKNYFVDLIYRLVACLEFIMTSSRKWSNSMAQYNLISSCLKHKLMCCKILKDNCIHKTLEKYQYHGLENVTPDLKELIFRLLVEKSKGASDLSACKQLCGARGEQVLVENNCVEQLGSTLEVEFDQSILLWHIATDLCYFSDSNRDPNSVNDPKCKMSKLISDYMLYILVKLPFMLPNGIGQIRFQDTCAEAMDFFQERKTISNQHLACEKLLGVEIRIPPAEVKGDRSKSVLFEACELAKSLQLQGKQQKWEIASHVWVEMLSYAASQCTWKHHAQELRHGGELLTHVWLLMSHLGLTGEVYVLQRFEKLSSYTRIAEKLPVEV